TALQGVENRCRELIVVTDGEAPVAPQVVANAIAQRVKINSIVIGAQAPLLLGAATTTGGKYISGRQENLEALFTDTFFGRFNSNLKWIIFWLGMAWIALMWLITMPLDRWVFQGIFKLHWSPAGKFALFHALFWTALTPAIVWRLTQLVGGLPFFGGC
ncbi:MAG: VWA domain-containing protein, partial [Chroococcales cyanobacterium]